MPEPLRVAVIFEGERVTGPAKNLLRFARGAQREAAGLPRLEIRMMTYQRGRREHESPLAAEARRAGIEVRVIRERSRFDPGVLPQIRRCVEEWRPQVVQTHQVKSHFLLRVSGLWRSHLWLAFHHGYTNEDLKMRLYNQLDRWSLPLADRVVTVCKAFARELEKRGVPRERIHVQHNAVTFPAPSDPETVRALKKTLVPEEGIPVLLTVGRLSREKGHKDLIEAARELRRLEPSLGFCLVVLGEGKERRRIEALCQHYGLEREVRLVGHQDEVAPYYAMADVVVIPSHSEGSPNVLLEAMASGVPVVATCVGGIPEIVADGETALLVPPHNPRALAGALARLLRSPEQRARLAQGARRLVDSEYTPEAYERSLRRVYQRLWEECSSRVAEAGS
ncbi:MAG: glycosyltransferase [Bryobacteraceae bacterium]|jgi:glycosyltransferase involved in cell wall biosynthesis|nr:glycosyltransferase [Bryobacteraceae bacterium]